MKTTPKRNLKNTTPIKKPQTPEFRQVLRRIKEKMRLKDLEAGQKIGGGPIEAVGIQNKVPEKCIKSEKFNNLKNIFEVKKEKGSPVKIPGNPHCQKMGRGPEKGGKSPFWYETGISREFLTSGKEKRKNPMDYLTKIDPSILHMSREIAHFRSTFQGNQYDFL